MRIIPTALVAFLLITDPRFGWYSIGVILTVGIMFWAMDDD